MNIKHISAASLMTLLLMTACNGEKKAADTQEELPRIKVETVEEQDVEQLSTYTATAEPENINNISSSMPSRIREILVDEGMRVAKGQKLVVMDDVNIIPYETQVDNARENLQNVQLNYNRAVELLKIGGGTQQQVDALALQLASAKNALTSAQRALSNVKENTVLTSPVSGVVTARNYDPGDMASGPILTVAQVNPIKIVINVTESEFSKIHKGMPAKVTFDTYGDEQFSGKITMVSPTIDHASRTFGVEVTMDNAAGRILPGMFGRVELNLGTENHVVVPDKAVVKQSGSGNQYVYVYNPQDGTVSYNKVELGRRMGNLYELTSGVPTGSQVVISGQSRLTNGAKVELQK